MIFVNSTYPQLRILLESGEYAQFIGGKLELDEGDPGFAEVLAEAQRNPSIAIVVNSTTCELCGEVFEGKAAKAQFTNHMKSIHPAVYDAEQELAHARSMEKQVKDRAGYACDVCQPVQTFGTELDLAEHVKLLHTAPPEMDDEGNEKADSRRPGEVAVPAARRSTKKG